MLGLLGYFVWRKRRGYDRARALRVGRLGRVVAYGVSVCAIGGLASTRAASADVGETAMYVGRELAPLADVLGETQKIRLNGESIFLSNALSTDAVPAVLARFEAYCHENAGVTAELWGKIAKAAENPQVAALLKDKKLTAFDKLGVYREGGATEGAVMCFTRSDRSGTDAKEAFKAFRATGDLGNLGKLRYAYAQRTEAGNTHVLTAWTEDSFNLSHVVEHSDADLPGDDSALAPRPPGGRRYFSAAVEGTPYGVRMYETQTSAAGVLAFYDTQMDGSGWATIKPPKEADRAGARGYQKGLLQVLVSATKGANGTEVTLSEVGRD